MKKTFISTIVIGVLTSLIIYLYSENQKLYNDKALYDTLTEKAFRSVGRENSNILHEFQLLSTELPNNSNKIAKKITKLNSLYKQLHSKSIEGHLSPFESLKYAMEINDSLISIAGSVCVLSLKFDDRFLITSPVYPKYSIGDTAIYSINLLTHHYLLPNTWEVTGSSEKGLKPNGNNKFTLMIPILNTPEFKNSSSIYSRTIEFYLHNTYNNTNDTLPSLIEFRVTSL